jgi:hypothetical protein
VKEEPATIECSLPEKHEADKKTSGVHEKQEDEIFYEDSFEAQDLQYNNALFAEDLKILFRSMNLMSEFSYIFWRVAHGGVGWRVGEGKGGLRRGGLRFLEESVQKCAISFCNTDALEMNCDGVRNQVYQWRNNNDWRSFIEFTV